MQLSLLVGVLVVIATPVSGFAGPEGVWIPAGADSVIKRIHISGSPFEYTATIDYRCATGVCSTLQSVSADSTNLPGTFFVDLPGVGPTPTLALRWQSGPPCNVAKSHENPLAFWASTIKTRSGKTQIGAVGHSWCLVRSPLAQHSVPPH